VILSIAATGHYYADMGSATNGEEPASLRVLLDEVCNERFRRINRFTQLALVGSGRCTREARLTEQTGLYIGSELGSIANTVTVQQQVVRDHRAPKPADFINTLSNTAGYYVARNLGLQGQNLFVSRGHASLNAAFQLARADFMASIITTALVGVVDECTIPLGDHARRLKLDPNIRLAESSHWFFIRPESAEPSQYAINASVIVHSPEELANWLQQETDPHTLRMHMSPGADHLLRDQPSFASLFNPDLAHYPSRTAGALIKFIESGQNGELLTISSDESGRLHLIHLART